jgi:hypothetical protein
MSEMNIKGTWKGIKTSPSISQGPFLYSVYSGRKSKGKGQAGIITGVLMQILSDSGDAILTDKEGFPHCVSLDTLQIIINN